HHLAQVLDDSLENGDAADFKVGVGRAAVQRDAQLVQPTIDQLHLAAAGQKRGIGVEDRVYAVQLEMHDDPGQVAVEQGFTDALQNSPAQVGELGNERLEFVERKLPG